MLYLQLKPQNMSIIAIFGVVLSYVPVKTQIQNIMFNLKSPIFKGLLVVSVRIFYKRIFRKSELCKIYCCYVKFFY